MASLHETFATEAAETLSALELGVLELERSGSDRGVLTRCSCRAQPQGAARVAGFAEVGELAHVAEELLVRLRDGKLRPSRGTVTILLAAIDELRAMIAAALDGASDDGGADMAVSAAGSATTSTVRVDTRRVDRLVDLIGENLMSRSPTSAMLRDRERSRIALLEAHGDAARLYDDLREAVMGLKLHTRLALPAQMIAAADTLRRRPA